MWSLFLMGCLDDSFLLGNRALDYHIDRPRVVAVRVTGELTEAGRPREVEALVLSPTPIERTAVSVCGYRTDAVVQVNGMECFSNAELVSPIGDQIPVVWTPPSIETDCETTPDTGGFVAGNCFSAVPVMVEVESEGRTGRGAFFSTVAVVSGFEELVEPAAPLTLNGPATARAGEEVVLTATTTSANYFQWWVDAGELRDTGRTGLRTIDEEAQMVTTGNRLRIPDDYSGDLRVAVVVPSGFGGVPLWTVHTIEVTP